MKKVVCVISTALAVGAILAGCGAVPQTNHFAGVNSPVSEGGQQVGTVNFQENGINGQRLVQVIQGHVPGIITGVVKTDTDCVPDAQGLSHCHNIIALANHAQITVIDSHNMSRVRCLKPGEMVTVQAVRSAWAKVSVSGR